MVVVANARVVTTRAVLDPGWVWVRDTRIGEIRRAVRFHREHGTTRLLGRPDRQHPPPARRRSGPARRVAARPRGPENR